MAPVVAGVKGQSFDKGAKRREKSRDAARCRRQQESDAFSEICEAIPVPTKQLAQMDRSTVMRLLISFMKLRKITNSLQFPEDGIKQAVSDNMPSDREYIDALNGFVIVLSHDCDLLFVSGNVKQYTGMASLDLLGQNLFSYTHEGDHSEITNCLKSSSEERKEHSFFMRVKSTLTSTGKTVNFKSATYKVFKCEGVVHQLPEQGHPYMVAYCEPIPHPANIEMVLDSSTFLSQHSLDMKLTYCDDRVHQLLGYSDDDMVGRSFYDFCHADDIKALDSAMKKLFRLGQVATNQYRLLAKSGGYAWIISQATVINNQRNQQPSYVVCVHYVVSGIVSGNSILSLPQLEVASSKVDQLVKQEKEEIPDEAAVQDYVDDIFCDSTDSIFRDIELEDVTKAVFSDDATSSVFVNCPETIEVLAKNAPSIGDEIDFDITDMFGLDKNLCNNAPSIGDPQWSESPASTAQKGSETLFHRASVNVDRVKGFLKENYAYGGPTISSQCYQPPNVKIPDPMDRGTPDSGGISPKRKLPRGDFRVVTLPKDHYRQQVQPDFDLLQSGRRIVDMQDPPLKRQKQHSVFDPGERQLQWKPNLTTGGLDRPGATHFSGVGPAGRYRQGDMATLARLLLQPHHECDNFDPGVGQAPSGDSDRPWSYMPKAESASSLLPVLSLDDCAVNAPVDEVSTTLDWATVASALNG